MFGLLWGWVLVAVSILYNFFTLGVWNLELPQCRS
jgi:hypothetical protein